jgi:hypothetical protein
MLRWLLDKLNREVGLHVLAKELPAATSVMRQAQPCTPANSVDRLQSLAGLAGGEAALSDFTSTRKIHGYLLSHLVSP